MEKMKKIEMKRRFVELLETYANERPLRLMEHEELLTLIGWYLNGDKSDMIFVISLLKECL